MGVGVVLIDRRAVAAEPGMVLGGKVQAPAADAAGIGDAGAVGVACRRAEPPSSGWSYMQRSEWPNCSHAVHQDLDAARGDVLGVVGVGEVGAGRREEGRLSAGRLRFARPLRRRPHEEGEM